MVHDDFSTSVTVVGSDPVATPSTILQTSSVFGKPMVDNLECMTVSFTVTSNEVLRPTLPVTTACGTCLK